jgi:ADP-ribose pyrophosphatase
MTRKTIYQGRKIEVVQDLRVSPDGRTVQRDLVLHPGAVAILPLVDAQRVCLLRNHRFTVEETLWEVPAGTLEPGEAPDLAAVRELSEETGYQAGSWRKLGEFYPSPGVLSERMYLYLAQDLTPGAMHLEADEVLEPQVVAWDQALAWVEDGTIRDGKTIVALLLWERIRSAPGNPSPGGPPGVFVTPRASGF